MCGTGRCLMGLYAPGVSQLSWKAIPGQLIVLVIRDSCQTRTLMSPTDLTYRDVQKAPTGGLSGKFFAELAYPEGPVRAPLWAHENWFLSRHSHCALWDRAGILGVRGWQKFSNAAADRPFDRLPKEDYKRPYALRIQIARSRYDLHTLGLKVSFVDILSSLGMVGSQNMPALRKTCRVQAHA